MFNLKMTKYDEPIYDKDYVQEALKIRLWEKFLLLFVPCKKVENEEFISYFKKAFGKFYCIGFKLKSFERQKD